METKANYVLIGSFVLLVFVAILGFIMWIVKLDIDREFTEYDIYFQESVAGLSTGGMVRYQGVDVGQVTSIDIDPDQPNRVRATVRIDSETPVREDAIASLQSQGFTGMSYILIEGGSRDSKPLRPRREGERAVITSRPSALSELFTDVPSMIGEASLTLSQIRQLLSRENQDNVRNILDNISTITDGVAARDEDIQATIVNLKDALDEYRKLAISLDSMTRSLDGTINNELSQTLTEVGEAARAVNRLTANLDSVVEEAAGPVNTFTTNTLPEITALVSEMRRLSATLGRVAERVERNPGNFFFEGKQPEYRAQ